MQNGISALNSKSKSLKGHLIESAVGAYLINRSIIEGFTVYWWREGNDEVDFVIADKSAVTAIEVKSGRVKSTSGMTKFLVENPNAHSIVVGSADCSIEAFCEVKLTCLFNSFTPYKQYVPQLRQRLR